MSDTMDTSSLLADYLEDARQHIDDLDDALLQFERGTASGTEYHDRVTALLGSLHTLKGNSGMMGFATVQQFVHQLESVFKTLQESPELLDASALDRLFESASALRRAVNRIGDDPRPDLSTETEIIASLLTRSPDRKRGRRSAAKNRKKVPGNGGAPTEPNRSESMPGSATGRSNILRVEFDRLDHLLNLAGELVIHKTKLNQIAKRTEELVGGEEFFGELPAAAQMIEKVTAELQEAIMRVRMLPVRHVFQRFPRMVRDLAKQKNKDVEIFFSGEDTEIDKTVIDAIGDPLLHLIRNSIDHGIEPPDVRRKAGKPGAGSIHLTARQESSYIVISVRDDGRGMDAGRIRKKAIERGLVQADQQLQDEELHNLIFAPGFSTAESVSETSGRGVGLDVVRKVIADFNGIIEVASTPGLGTEFTLKMPLTLAIIPALLVESSGHLYAVPLTAVIESVKISAGEIHRADGREVVQLRGALLPVKRLSDMLDMERREAREYYMVVLARAEKRMGLLVDRLQGQQDVVIKALDEYLGDINGISGATILGDGSVVLIVDTARIMSAGRI